MKQQVHLTEKQKLLFKKLLIKPWLTEPQLILLTGTVPKSILYLFKDWRQFKTLIAFMSWRMAGLQNMEVTENLWEDKVLISSSTKEPKIFNY